MKDYFQEMVKANNYDYKRQSHGSLFMEEK